MITAKTKPKFLCLPYTKKGGKKIKRDYKENESERLNKKRKGFLTALATTIRKDPTTSISELTNELKVHKKTVMASIKQPSTT